MIHPLLLSPVSFCLSSLLLSFRKGSSGSVLAAFLLSLSFLPGAPMNNSPVCAESRVGDQAHRGGAGGWEEGCFKSIS